MHCPPEPVPYGEPKLMRDTADDHQPTGGTEPRLDWANGLMREVRDHVVRCASRYVHNADVADELAQAIVAELWIGHGEAMRWYDEEQLKAFLGTVVRRRIIDFRRRREARRLHEDECQRLLEDTPRTSQPSPERDQAIRELGDRIDRAVSELPPAAQQIYQLYLGRVAHKEIAERLNVTSGYVAVTIARASARVREKLADWAPRSYSATTDGVPRKPGRPRRGFFGKRDHS